MPPADATAAQLLATPLQYLKGVGPARAELLDRLGLHAVRDVLFFFPRDYQDIRERELDQLEEGKFQSVRGVVEDIDLRSTFAGGCILGVSIRCRTGQLRAIWFNQPFMREKFSFGQRVMLSGKPKYEGLVWQMHHPQMEVLDAEEEEPVAKILPVYPLTEGLQQWQMRKIVRGAVEAYADKLDEVFPEEYLRRHDLWPLSQALPQVHFPSDQESLDRARRRLVYQELFILQLALAVRRQQQHDQRKAPVAGGHGQDRRPHPPAVPLRTHRGTGTGHRRDCRRHGRPAADEPAFARRRGERQDRGGGLRHAAGGGPRLPGRADGPHRSPRPATCPDDRTHAGRQPGPPRPIDRRADERLSGPPCCN